MIGPFRAAVKGTTAVRDQIATAIAIEIAGRNAVGMGSHGNRHGRTRRRHEPAAGFGKKFRGERGRHAVEASRVRW
jgi:hypothetical protein